MTDKSNKVREWQGKVAKARMNRKNYPAGPAAGPGIWHLYKGYFNYVLRGRKQANILVLGATPEYRDYALQLGHNVVTVDFSMEMIQKMSQVMKHQNHPREVLVRGNWLELDFLAADYFDLAVGSGITNNILPGTHARFFKGLQRVLKKNGYILLHDAVILPDKKAQSFQWYIDEYRRGRLHWFDIFMTARFYSDLTDAAKSSQYVYDMKRFGDSMARHYSRMSISLVRNLEHYRGKIAHTLFPEKILMRMMAKYFNLLPTERAHDYLFCDFIYHILGRVKK